MTLEGGEQRDDSRFEELMPDFLTARTGAVRSRLGFSEDQDNLVGLLFVLPDLVVFAIFLFAPVAYAFYVSLQNWNILLGHGEFAWTTLMGVKLPIQNYLEVLKPAPIQGSLGNLHLNTKVLTTPTANTFWYAMRNTFVYAIGTVPLQIYGGLAVALMLDKRVRFKKTYRAAYFMPVMLSGAASAVMWRWFLSADGVVNSLLRPVGEFVGVALAHNWAGNPKYALTGVMLMAVWGGIGSNMIFFLAGLQNIPDELYEASRIDGASRWHRFRHVTWPNLGNTNFFVIVMAIISAFQVFGIAMVYSEGGPLYSTTTVVLLIYRRAFEEGQMGLGAAMAFILFLIILSFSYYQYKHRDQGEVSY